MIRSAKMSTADRAASDGQFQDNRYNLIYYESICKGAEYILLSPHKGRVSSSTKLSYPVFIGKINAQ